MFFHFCAFGQKNEKIEINFGAGLSFIPVFANEITSSYNSSVGLGSNSLAIKPTFHENKRIQLRSNLMLESKFKFTFIQKENWKIGTSLTAGFGIHLPWSEEFDAELKPTFSIGANIFYQLNTPSNFTYNFGYKYSLGGLEFYQPIIGCSFNKIDLFASCFRHKHYRQLSNGDLKVSKRIFEIGFRFYFYNF